MSCVVNVARLGAARQGWARLGSARQGKGLTTTARLFWEKEAQMSAMKEVKYTLTGISPILMNNGRGVNPLDPLVRHISILTDKKAAKRTEEDWALLAKCEWFLNIYHDGNGEEFDKSDIIVDSSARVIIPAQTIEAVVTAGAKKSRCGPSAKAGVIASSDAKLTYTGPKDLNTLYEKGQHFLCVAVKIGQKRIMRTRPRFPAGWSVVFSLLVDESLVDEVDLFRWLQDAGRQCGMGDWIPRYGRFEVSRGV